MKALGLFGATIGRGVRRARALGDDLRPHRAEGVGSVDVARRHLQLAPDHGGAAWSASAPRSRSARICRASRPASCAAASRSPSPIAAPTCRRSARARCARATTPTSSTAPRPGSRTASTARCFALLVKTDPAAEPRHKGMSMLLAEKGPGFRVSRKLEKIGYKGIDPAELIFEDYRVPASALIGGARGADCRRRSAGWSSAASTSRRAAAASPRRRSTSRCATRSCARPSASRSHEHQAIQLKLAEMAIRTEAAIALTYNAAQGLRRGPALRHGGRHGQVRGLRGGGGECASRPCASTAPTATRRSSTSSATTATRPLLRHRRGHQRAADASSSPAS